MGKKIRCKNYFIVIVFRIGRDQRNMHLWLTMTCICSPLFKNSTCQYLTVTENCENYDSFNLPLMFSLYIQHKDEFPPYDAVSGFQVGLVISVTSGKRMHEI